MQTESSKDLLRKKEQYRKDLVKLAKESSRKVGYHFNCPDGIVSAALIRSIFPNEILTFIPIDYPMLKDQEVVHYFLQTEWFAIVDLSPFNTKEIEYYFDHHISNKDKEIKAKQHLFDFQAPSAAALIAKYFSDRIPDFLKELADLTEITDTASYKIPAPLNLEKNYKNLSWDEKTWFLEDACKTTYTIPEHNELINILSSTGLRGLWKDSIIKRIEKLRQSRKEAYEIAENLELKDFVIIVDNPFHYNTAYIARGVMKRGAIGAAYITDYPGEVKLSLRLSRSLSPEEVEKYRVDLLANQMSGGGHKGASGAEAENLEFALDKIIKWTKQKNLTSKILNLKEK